MLPSPRRHSPRNRPRRDFGLDSYAIFSFLVWTVKDLRQEEYEERELGRLCLARWWFCFFLVSVYAVHTRIASLLPYALSHERTSRKSIFYLMSLPC